MFAVIRNPIALGYYGLFSGLVESRHRTAAAAHKAIGKLNKACQRANGMHTFLDLKAVEISTDYGAMASGTFAARP
jgi:hypothetical protein